MDVSAVEQTILNKIPGAHINAEGEDCSFSVTVYSEVFAGKLPVARQKLILSLFKDQLASGELHALSVKAMAPGE